MDFYHSDYNRKHVNYIVEQCVNTETGNFTWKYQPARGIDA
jgi:hypothetical protein